MLKLENISKYYVNDTQVVAGIKDISLAFCEGEFVAITGASGSGKTTLLNILAGTDNYNEGSMVVCGEETEYFDDVDWVRYRKELVSFVYQDYNLIEGNSVWQNVELAYDLNCDKEGAVRKQEIENILRQVGMLKYARQERRVKNTGQAPQKYVENNHPAIIDRTTWNAVQAEIERRASLRSTEQTGKGRYSGQYAFSGRIECGCCGAGFRRHNYRGEGVWACKQHIRSKELCGQVAIKESHLERVFVKALNELIHNRKEIAKVVGVAVGEAMLETGEGTDAADRIKELDNEIESLQAQMLELNKKRGKRELDSEAYNAESRKVMERLDGLFIQRDNSVQEKTAAALNTAFGSLVASFLDDMIEQTEFDKDIFIRLVEVVRIKGKDHIIFEMKDGTEFRANLDGMTD